MIPLAQSYVDLAHTERLEYERKLAALERMCAHHVAVRQSQEHIMQQQEALIADLREELDATRLALRYKIVRKHWIGRAG